jgi:hypothetical protein
VGRRARDVGDGDGFRSEIRLAWMASLTARRLQSAAPMTQRSPISVLLLTFFTFGIYGIYWMLKTKGELNERGADIPTAWIVLVPFLSIYWLWKYSEGVATVTNGQQSAPITLLLIWILGPIGLAITQDQYNRLPGLPVARLA